MSATAALAIAHRQASATALADDCFLPDIGSELAIALATKSYSRFSPSGRASDDRVRPAGVVNAAPTGRVLRTCAGRQAGAGCVCGRRSPAADSLKQEDMIRW
jgi:hypothetical protein